MIDRLDSRRIDYMPSPAEIRSACTLIQNTWTLNERRKRYIGSILSGDTAPQWQPPVIATASFRSMSVCRGVDLAS